MGPLGSSAIIDGIGSRLGMGPLSPPAIPNEDVQSDPENLGPQLSLLNLISSQGQSDDLGNTGTALFAFANLDTCWIIHLGVIDHMTYDRTLFNSTRPPLRDSIVTTNGRISPVTGADDLIKTLISGLFDVASPRWHFPGQVGIETTECGGLPDDDDLIEPTTNRSADIASPLGFLPASVTCLNGLFCTSAICPIRSIAASPSNISNDNSYHTLPIPVNDSTYILEIST
ncbi:hypothetical protein ACFX1S_007588 [Malus domestica]